MGPASGAGFSDGPDRGATIAPVGYGHTELAGTHTVTLVGKSNPVATAIGVGRLAAGEGHLHHPAPVVGRTAAGQGPG